MASVPQDPEQPRRVLELVLRDPEAATRAIDRLSHAQQVALVCETPLANRSAMLAALPKPEAVVPFLPEAELCFTVKAIGLSDATWLLEHATPEQVVASVDLDVWRGNDIDPGTLGEWIEALAATSSNQLLRSVQALDPELLVILLKSRILVFQKPNDDDGWTQPDGTQTLEGQFFFRAHTDNDDLEGIAQLLHNLFENDYWTYFRMMQGVVWELDSDTTEWSLRWRTGRLEDLGFPPWDEAMRIYRFLSPEDRATLPARDRVLSVEEWALPIWLPELPEASGPGNRIFRAIAELDDEERQSCFFEFVAVANKVAVADHMALSDAESTPTAIAKAALLISEGLAHVAEAHTLVDVAVLRRMPLERLFAIGANLDPIRARPT